MGGEQTKQVRIFNHTDSIINFNNGANFVFPNTYDCGWSIYNIPTDSEELKKYYISISNTSNFKLYLFLGITGVTIYDNLQFAIQNYGNDIVVIVTQI